MEQQIKSIFLGMFKHFSSHQSSDEHECLRYDKKITDGFHHGGVGQTVGDKTEKSRALGPSRQTNLGRCSANRKRCQDNFTALLRYP